MLWQVVDGMNGKVGTAPVVMVLKVFNTGSELAKIIMKIFHVMVLTLRNVDANSIPVVVVLNGMIGENTVSVTMGTMNEVERVRNTTELQFVMMRRK